MPLKQMSSKRMLTLLARAKCLMSHITNVGAILKTRIERFLLMNSQSLFWESHLLMPTDRQMWELNLNQPKATWEKSWDSEPSMPAIATKLQATTKLKASGKEINSLEQITVPKNQQVQVEKAENFTSLNLTRKWKQSCKFLHSSNF